MMMTAGCYRDGIATFIVNNTILTRIKANWEFACDDLWTSLSQATHITPLSNLRLSRSMEGKSVYVDLPRCCEANEDIVNSENTL